MTLLPNNDIIASVYLYFMKLGAFWDEHKADSPQDTQTVFVKNVLWVVITVAHAAHCLPQCALYHIPLFLVLHIFRGLPKSVRPRRIFHP